jgi:transcriptional regulator with XRE-family HTH domain
MVHCADASFKQEEMLPSGHMLKSARALAGLTAVQLAKLARLDASTISRMESAGPKPVRAMGHNIEAVLQALDQNGVEIDPANGIVRLKKPRR